MTGKSPKTIAWNAEFDRDAAALLKAAARTALDRYAAENGQPQTGSNEVPAAAAATPFFQRPAAQCFATGEAVPTGQPHLSTETTQ